MCTAAYLEAADLDTELLVELLLQRLHLGAVVVPFPLELDEEWLALAGDSRIWFEDGLCELECRAKPPPAATAAVVLPRRLRRAAGDRPTGRHAQQRSDGDGEQAVHAREER